MSSAAENNGRLIISTIIYSFHLIFRKEQDLCYWEVMNETHWAELIKPPRHLLLTWTSALIVSLSGKIYNQMDSSIDVK